MTGITSIRKSVPFLKASLLMATMLIVFKGYLQEGSGIKRVQSTALGITLIISGFRKALRVRFSLEVWDTEIAWSTSLRLNLTILFRLMQAISSNPNRLWSVYTVL
jgi:hypothetical protein